MCRIITKPKSEQERLLMRAGSKMLALAWAYRQGVDPGATGEPPRQRLRSNLSRFPDNPDHDRLRQSARGIKDAAAAVY
jgi:hypothetical protein